MSDCPIPSQVLVWDNIHSLRRQEVMQPSWLAKKYVPFLLDQGIETILDLGYGRGADLLYFAQSGLRAYGVDFSPVAVNTVKERVALYGVTNVFLVLTDYSVGLPFRNNAFDSIFAYLGLHYFDDAGTDFVFSEIYRVLHPRGFLIGSVKSTDDYRFGKGERLGKCMYLLNDQVRRFFTVEFLDKVLQRFNPLTREQCNKVYDASGIPSNMIYFVAQKE